MIIFFNHLNIRDLQLITFTITTHTRKVTTSPQSSKWHPAHYTIPSPSTAGSFLQTLSPNHFTSQNTLPAHMGQYGQGGHQAPLKAPPFTLVRGRVKRALCHIGVDMVISWITILSYCIRSSPSVYILWSVKNLSTVRFYKTVSRSEDSEVRGDARQLTRSKSRMLYFWQRLRSGLRKIHAIQNQDCILWRYKNLINV